MTEQPHQADVPVPAPAPLTAHPDPEGQAPWALQLVVRVERTDPPTRTAACEAAAVAVVTLVHDERAQPGGPWAAAVTRWTDGRIRKHCRRARGAAWDKVQDQPGVTVEVGGVQVRAVVPGPTDQIPRDLAKLQLSGTELEDPDVVESVTAVVGGPVVVSISADPVLPFGKAAAAAGHAAQVAALQMAPERLSAWADQGYPVIVEHPDTHAWNALLTDAPVRIVDAGFTAVAPGTTTATARWA